MSEALQSTSHEEVERILRETDWSDYHRRVSWAVRRPGCPLYDGEHLCPVWCDWVRDGRELYEEKELIVELRESHSGLTEKVVKSILSGIRP